MVWYQALSIILGSGVVVAVINLIMDRLHRKDTVSDRTDNTTEQIGVLRKETTDQFAKVDTRIEGVEKKVDILSDNTNLVMRSTKAQAYDCIRRLGLGYIKSNEINVDELKNLTEMYDVYIEITGEEDTFLNRIMDEVYTLRVKYY